MDVSMFYVSNNINKLLSDWFIFTDSHVSFIQLKQILLQIKEKEMQKVKMVVWGGLKNSCEKKRNERQRR